MDDQLTGSPGMSAAEWRGKRLRAFEGFVAAYADMQAHRTHDTEREAAKHLAECVDAEDMSREVFRQAWDLLDRLAENDVAAWARVFRAAIKVGVPYTEGFPLDVWRRLKSACGSNVRYVSLMSGDGEEIMGDTLGVMTLIEAGLAAGTVPGATYKFEDGWTLLIFTTEA